MLYAALLVAAAAAAAPPPPLRILILSGQNNHDWRTTTPFLRQTLEATGRFDVRVTEEPAGLTAATLAAYDAVVSDYNGVRLGDGAEKALDAFVRGGKGIVLVHAASYAFCGMEILGDKHKRTGRFEAAWTDYGKLAGAVWSAEEPKTGHGARHVFDVKAMDRNHPVMRGLPETLRASDELYHHFRFTDRFHLLASAFDDPKQNGTGKDEPLIWVKPWGKGRVFHTALGHDVAAMMEPAFRLPFVRGVEWAATGDVLDAPPAAQAKRPRLLVVTGGHAYQTSFYTLFDEYEWGHEFRLDNAFKRDQRKQYDVLVLYNMEQEIGEAARRNLQAFVEAGKGVLVLHHAICSFNEWDWYRDLVGGRYQVKAREGVKASRYDHDQEFTVRPAAKHPVLAGVPEFHITDEGYMDQWISPDIRPLLTVEHPRSDREVAWISPYAKARVVVVQLGHDHLAYRNPIYRLLLRNAITWISAKQ
jgi:type 1 glutamine amidotransferase